jgi:hypothetical protein
LVEPRSFLQTWITLKAPEDIEPNLLSIVVTRSKLAFLEGSKFPEFSTVLQQKWDIFGKRLITFWVIAVLCVFALFQTFVISVVNEVKQVPYAAVTQERLASALYVIAGTFLFLDGVFEYTLGTVRSEEELDNVGATHDIGSLEYPIDLLDVDMPPWNLASTFKELKIDESNPRSKEIKEGLTELSRFISNRHCISNRQERGSTDTAVPSFPRGWKEGETKLFRQFVGFNYCARSSLSFCSKILQHNNKYPHEALDIILENYRNKSDDNNADKDVTLLRFSQILKIFFGSLPKMLKRSIFCFFGLHDSRGLYSHMWCIFMLLSALATHYENFDLRITFLSVATVFMFLYVLRFYLLFETLGVYMVTIMHMLSTDLTKWIAVAAIYWIAFSEAFVLIGMVLSPNEESSGFFLTQFKWVLGDSTTEGFDKDPKAAENNPSLHRFAVILFCIFMILLPVTLINMLTGMFSKTCEDYVAQAQAIHRYNRAIITLSLERVLYRLPVPILWLLGFRSNMWPFESIYRSLSRREAPPPPQYIFRYHRAAFHNVFQFWPTRYTFVNCRTGYPLDAAESVFHKDMTLHWSMVPFSFYCHSLEKELNALLRMNAKRAFYFFKHKQILQNFQEIIARKMLFQYGTIALQSTAGGTLSSPPEPEVKIPRWFSLDDFEEVCKKLEVDMMNSQFDEILVSNVIKHLKNFVTNYKFDEKVTNPKDVFFYRLLYQLCNMIETEFVNNDQYHLLMKDFHEST